MCVFLVAGSKQIQNHIVDDAMLSEGELERRVRGLREKYGAETNIAAFHKSWASLDLDARRKWIEDAKSMGESLALGGPNPSNQPILARVLASSVSLSLCLSLSLQPRRTR